MGPSIHSYPGALGQLRPMVVLFHPSKAPLWPRRNERKAWTDFKKDLECLSPKKLGKGDGQRGWGWGGLTWRCS